MREFGQELVSQAFPKKPRAPRKVKPEGPISKKQAKLHRKFLKQNPGVNFNPEPKPPKHDLGMSTLEPTEVLGWSRVKYDQESYTAVEVVVMVRPSPDLPPRVLLNMKNVRGYVDMYGSIMLRPTTAPAEQGGTLALPAPTEAANGSKKPAKGIRTTGPIVLGGTYNLNPAKEGTKRFFLVESLLKGGTAVEIVKGADKMARKGGYKKGEVQKIITPTTKKVTEFAQVMADKIGRGGKRVKVVVIGKQIQMVLETAALVSDSPEP